MKESGEETLFGIPLNRLRVDRILGPFTRIHTPAPFESTDQSHGHVMITNDLTAQSYA